MDIFALKDAKSINPPPDKSIGADAPSIAASHAACKNSSLVSTRLAALAAAFSGDNSTTVTFFGR